MEDIKIINDIVDKEICNNIDMYLKYREIAIYQGMDGCVKFVQDLTKCSKENALQSIIDNELVINETPQEYEYRTRKANQEAMESLNKPKCPICSSTNIKKISGLSKAGSVALFGVFAVGKVSKQWKCSNCGSEF